MFKQDEATLIRANNNIITLGAGITGEREDGRGDEGVSHGINGNNQISENNYHAETAAHDMFAASILNLANRLAILEASTTITSIAIVGTVSRIWTEKLMFVSLSAIYDEAKATSWSIRNGITGALASFDFGDGRKREYTTGEMAMYDGKDYHKIHGQRNPNLNAPTFDGSGRQGVGIIDLDYLLVSAVDRYETCPRRARMILTSLKMKNGVTFGDLENLGGTEPLPIHFHDVNMKIIRYFDVEHKEGTVGSFQNEVISKGQVNPNFNASKIALNIASVGIFIALKAAGLDLEKTFETVTSAYNELIKQGGTMAEFFAVDETDTAWLHTLSVEDALVRLQDLATEDYGGPFALAYEYENDSLLGRGAKVGCDTFGNVKSGTYSHATLIDKTGLTQVGSFRNHTLGGKTIDAIVLSYRPREEYNTLTYAGLRSASKFGFDTLEYEFRGVNTGFDLAVDASASLWRNASPTRTEFVEGEGDAIAMNGKLFAVYDYSATAWKWVKGDTSLIS
jgi:hypothetical protein